MRSQDGGHFLGVGNINKKGVWEDHWTSGHFDSDQQIQMQMCSQW